jgi:Zn-dependent protease/CBS domain-containing protein
MKANLSLGKISNIKIQVHWTFFFLIVWIVFEEFNRGGSTESVFFNIALVLAVFFCVVLHELGHALTAKRFGIATKNITLLPIGGIASLDKIPEDPKQELAVAIAGPLVNIIIAIFLYFSIPIQDFTSKNLGEALEYLANFSLKNFLLYLFIVNVAMFVFNLIPAFPMDGGRVFRALLALKINRMKATQIATNVGQFIAVLFLLVGLLFNPFLIFIALIIFLGAYGENKYVQSMLLLKNHTVNEAMLKNITKLYPDNTVSDVVDILLSGSETNFIVINKAGSVEGVLYHEDIIKNSKNRLKPVKELMRKSFKTIKLNSDLPSAYRTISNEKHPFFPVMNNSKLEGAIDLNNLNEFIMLQAKMEY